MEDKMSGVGRSLRQSERLSELQFLSKDYFTSPLRIRTHNTHTGKHNTKHSINSPSHCTIQQQLR